MNEQSYRIALCGPSGSGKSTLARFISDHYGLPYTENSAGLLLPEPDQNYLIKNFGWTKSGHKDVIRMSHINPQFGWEFQYRLLKARARFIQDNPSFVIDRSPIDNMAYFLLQCSALMDQGQTKAFIDLAVQTLRGLTHIIFIPTMLTGEVEDNGSRVSNFFYQQMVTAVFIHVIHNYNPGVKVLELNTSDQMIRRQMVSNFLRH